MRRPGLSIRVLDSSTPSLRKGSDPMLSHRAAQGSADDLCILALDTKSMKVQTSKVAFYNKWSHLDANPKKCATAILHGDVKAGIAKNATDFTRIHSQLQNIEIFGAPIPCIPPDMPYRYLGLQMTLTLNWRHQVAGVINLLKDKGNRLVQSFASPKQRLRFLQRCIIPAVTYSFPVAPYTRHDIKRFDAMISNIAKRCLNTSTSCPSAQVHEDKNSCGWGVPSLLVD